MLEPHEWATIERARHAGVEFESVLNEAQAALPPGRSYTPLHHGADVNDHRNAYLLLGYELFTGIRERRLGVISHHRTDLYGPPCTRCDKPLRTPQARWCAACGHERADAPSSKWNDSRAVRLHKYPIRRMTIAGVLSVGPSLLLSDDERIGRRVMPWEEDGWLLSILDSPAFGLVVRAESDPRLARMVGQLALFHRALEFDSMQEYLESDDADHLPEVMEHCAELEAPRAVALVQALLTLYPAELRVHTSKRAAYLIELDDDPSSSRARALAIAHWDVVREIPARLESFVRAHIEEFEDALRETRAARRRKSDVQNAPYATGPIPNGTDIAKIFHNAAVTVARIQSLTRALKPVGFPPHTTELPVGTLLEVRDGIFDDAAMIYLQVTHRHELEPMLGPVVRVIDGWHDARPSNLDVVASRPTLRVGVLPNEISPAKIATALGVFPIPMDDQRFPRFRSEYGTGADGVQYWGVWSGGSESTQWYREPLPDDIARLEVLAEPRSVQRLIKGE